MTKHRKRPQAPKSRRSAVHQREVLELRQGSTTSPHASVRDYQRKPKHTGKGWA